MTERMPPLGIEPRLFWLERRYIELSKAIRRYEENDFPVPPAWVGELHWLNWEISSEQTRSII